MTELERKQEQEQSFKTAQSLSSRLAEYYGLGSEEFLMVLEDVEHKLSGLGAKARRMYMPYLLQELQRATRTQLYLREQDCQCLINHCSLLLVMCAESFQQRLTNYNWWHATVVFYHHLSGLGSPHQNGIIFNQDLLQKLIQSLKDLSVAADHSEKALITETNRLVLLTLANVVDSNPYIAADVQKLNVAESLQAMSPLKSAEPRLVNAVVDFFRAYFKHVPYLDPQADRTIYEFIEQILRLDLGNYLLSVSSMLNMLDMAFYKLKIASYIEWENRVFECLFDIFEQLKASLLTDPKMSVIDSLFGGVTHSAGAFLRDRRLSQNSKMKEVFHHQDWQVISDGLVKKLEADNEDFRIKSLAVQMIMFWNHEYFPHRDTNLPFPIPGSTPLLFIHAGFVKEKSAALRSIVRSLSKSYFAIASFDELNFFLGYATELLNEKTDPINDNAAAQQHIEAIKWICELISSASAQLPRASEDRLEMPGRVRVQRP